jgi:cell division septation protein DedD
MDLTNISKRERTLIYLAYVVILLLCVAILYNYVLSPALGNYNSTVKRYNSQQEENKRISAKRDALIKEYISLKSRYDEANRLLFTKIQADDWLEMLPVLSQRTGNDITSLTPLDSKAVSDEGGGQSNVDKTKLTEADKISEDEKQRVAILAGISEMPVTIGIRGKYSDIINLFDTLEGFKQLMVISGFNVSQASKDPNQVETSFQLNLIHTNTNAQALPIESFPLAIQLAKATEKEPKVELQPPTPEPEPIKNVNPRPKLRTKYRTNSNKAIASQGTVYSVQIGAFGDKNNSDELAKLMKDKGYEPWIKYESNDKSVPNRVLAGQFKSQKEADKFGKVMKDELPWVDNYLIKKTK